MCVGEARKGAPKMVARAPTGYEKLGHQKARVVIHRMSQLGIPSLSLPLLCPQMGVTEAELPNHTHKHRHTNPLCGNKAAVGTRSRGQGASSEQVTPLLGQSHGRVTRGGGRLQDQKPMWHPYT